MAPARYARSDEQCAACRGSLRDPARTDELRTHNGVAARITPHRHGRRRFVELPARRLVAARDAAQRHPLILEMQQYYGALGAFRVGIGSLIGRTAQQVVDAIQRWPQDQEAAIGMVRPLADDGNLAAIATVAWMFSQRSWPASTAATS